MPVEVNSSPRIVSGGDELYSSYREMARGDIVFGRIRVRATEEQVLLDLAARGVRCIPSGLSQLVCRSKTFQALIYSEFMLPFTKAIHDIHDLLECMVLYGKENITDVVTKIDRCHGGRGVNRWNSIEDVYNQATLGSLVFPFVIQPFLADARDVRVIIIGDYVEAYRRHNRYNFRHNLHFGGHSEEMDPTGHQLDFCRLVMDRGEFPYAHLDLMISAQGSLYLSEINLRGGIKGARISPAAYRIQVAEQERKLLHVLLEGGTA